MTDSPKFARVASVDEIRAITEAYSDLPVERSLAVESCGWSAVGALHDALQSELGFRQRRQLVNSFRSNGLAGSREWMIANLPDYQARFAVACRQVAQSLQDVADQLLGGEFSG